MRACRYAGVACLVVLSLQTAFAAKVPGWVNGSTGSAFPAEKYLTGVGIGSSLDLARSNARAEIAKIFQTRIIQSSEETTREHSLQGTANAGFSAENSSALSTKTSTEDILQGAEIAETHFDARKQTYYALAVLDKGKMRRSLAQEIAELDETIASQVALARKDASVIDGIRAFNKALKAWERKDMLLVKQRVVDPAAVPEIPTQLSRGQVQREKEAVSRKIVFILDNGPDGGPGLDGIPGERITGLGFTIASSTAAVDGSESSFISVKSRIAVEPIERNNPNWKFCNWNVAMEMSDMSNGGRVIAAVSRQGQASHVSESAARDKAVAEAAHELAVTVEQQVRQYILGE